MNLKGKVALVTGAASGIGLNYIKIMFANGLKHAAILDFNRQAGAAVAEQLNRQFGADSTLFVACDASDMQQLEDGFNKAMNKFKKIDIVVNNVGIMRDSEWEKEIALNFNSVVKGTLLALDLMGKDKGGAGGVVVNIASIIGLVPVGVLPVYCGTKHAVVAFSQSLGAPFHEERTGVRVMTLCPSATDTSLIADATSHVKHPEWLPEMTRFLASVPLQKSDAVANGLLHILKTGKSSSVWVVENDLPAYEVQFPEYQTLKVKIDSRLSIDC